MDKLFAQIKEYLNMEDELPYPQFNAYYQTLMDFMQTNYESLKEEEIHQGRYIFIILESNCLDRAKNKGSQMKKYKKMAEKCQLWANATTFKLRQLGLDEKQINEAYESINESI